MINPLISHSILKKGIKMVMVEYKNLIILFHIKNNNILKEYIDYYDDKEKIKEELLEDKNEYRRQNRKNFIGPQVLVGIETYY